MTLSKVETVAGFFVFVEFEIVVMNLDGSKRVRTLREHREEYQDILVKNILDHYSSRDLFSESIVRRNEWGCQVSAASLHRTRNVQTNP